MQRGDEGRAGEGGDTRLHPSSNFMQIRHPGNQMVDHECNIRGKQQSSAHTPPCTLKGKSDFKKRSVFFNFTAHHSHYERLMMPLSSPVIELVGQVFEFVNVVFHSFLATNVSRVLAKERGGGKILTFSAKTHISYIHLYTYTYVHCY